MWINNGYNLSDMAKIKIPTDPDWRSSINSK